MHRSGTSFVASFLQRAGVHVGDELVGPSIGNELGHFENARIMAFHERLLERNGFAREGWMTDRAIEPDDAACDEALALLAQEARPTPWGWKDPRSTFFVEFWARIEPAATFLVLYREPAEVVASLYRRGDAVMQSHPETAARAWFCHNAHLLRFIRKHGERCIVANVAGVVADPHGFLRCVSARYDARVTTDAAAPYEPSMLRMQERDDPRLTLVRHFAPGVGELYAEIERIADIPSGLEVGTPSDVSAAYFAYMRDATASNTDS